MQLNMGLTTEMDVNEAFAAYRRVRELVLFLLVSMSAIRLMAAPHCGFFSADARLPSWVTGA
jgi:hypothetical protein